VNQASIAYDSARRLEESEHMRQAAEALAGVATLSEVLTQIVLSAREVLRADSTAIWTYDDFRDKFILESSLAAGIPEELWQEFRRQEPRPGQTAFTVMERGWVGINDISDRDRYPYIGQSTRSLLGQNGVQSFQGIALMVGEEKLGVLYVNYNRSRTFSEEKQETARTFANHAALALKKATLLEQVNKVSNTARVVAKMTAVKDLGETLQSVVSGMKDALDCDAVTLYVYDPGRDKLRYPPTIIGVRFEDRVHRLEGVAPDSIIMTMLRRDEIYIVDTSANDPLFRDKRFTREENIISCAAVPLTVSQGKVGVMFVNYRAEHRFTSDEITNIELFANQAAVAIHAAQLYAEVQARADALQALYEAGRIATSSLKLEDIFSAIVEQAWRLTGIDGPKAQFCTLSLLEGRNLNPVATYPLESLPEFMAAVGHRDLENDNRIGVTGRAAKTGETQLLGDITWDNDYISFKPETRSELAIPLKIGDLVIGVINVEHPDKNAFDYKDRQVLESLASQAAIAIQNAQAYREATILQELSSSLVGALKLGEVLDLVMGAAMDLTNTGSGSILFWDEQVQRFAPAFTTMGAENKLTLYTSTARREGRAWNILHNRKPVIVTDIHLDPNASEVALEKRRRALIGVPL
ncbi:MAG: GAF domain-containing protein, partial [Candidatus Promineifilaceae bacterium]